MSFDEAKKRLDELRGQITNHNTNIKKYTEKKREVLKILEEINGLIDRIVSRVGENSSAATQLQELINLITKDLPDMEGELTATELDDVISALVKVKTKLDKIVGAGDGSEGTWHHAVDDEYGEYYWNDVTNQSVYKGDLPSGAKMAHKGEGQHKEDDSKVHPQKSTAGGPPTGGSPEGTRSGNFIRRGDGLVSANSQEGGRKRGGFKFTSNAIKSRKSRYMTRKRKSKSPKRRQKTRKTPKRRKRTRRKRRKGRKRRRKSQRKRRR